MIQAMVLPESVLSPGLLGCQPRGCPRPCFLVLDVDDCFFLLRHAQLLLVGSYSLDSILHDTSRRYIHKITDNALHCMKFVLASFPLAPHLQMGPHHPDDLV